MGKQVIQIGHKQGYTGKEVKSEADYVKEAKQRLNDKVADFRNMANELFLERENLYRESPNSRAIINTAASPRDTPLTVILPMRYPTNSTPKRHSRNKDAP